MSTFIIQKKKQKNYETDVDIRNSNMSEADVDIRNTKKTKKNYETDVKICNTIF